jgi:hypothetical protein
MPHSAVTASRTQLLFVTKCNSLWDPSVYHAPSFAVPMTWSNAAAANRNAGTRRGITTLCRHLETQTETDGRSLAAELGHAVKSGALDRHVAGSAEVPYNGHLHIRIIRSLSS